MDIPEAIGAGQHGEDRILGLVFRDQPTGFLVDVGAADGFTNSNSIGLLKRPGWRGVLIEPERNQYMTMLARYKDSSQVSCLNCAVGPTPGTKTLWANGQASTLDPKTRQAATDMHGIAFEEQSVGVRTLKDILVSLGIRDVDFLSIDAEGMSYPVWQSLGGYLLPKLVCIEGKGYEMPGYRELCRLGANTFYLREDQCPIL